MFIRHTSFLLLLLSAAGCPASEAPEAAAPEIAEAEPAPSERDPESFVDVRSYLTAPADIDAWYELTSNLESDFDSVCGDTFCEGDYSNYESLGFRCSAEQRKGTLGACVWVFAASNEHIAASTGNVQVHARTWRCAIPLDPRTSISDFLEALAPSRGQPIYATLPGTDSSLYDGLVDCL